MAARTALQRPGGGGTGLRTPVERRQRRRSGGLLFGAAACIGCFVGIFWLLRSVPAPRPAPPPPAPNPWVRIIDPLPLYDLPVPMFGSQKPSYEAWRARSGQGRRDLMILGNFGEDAPYLQLAILQPRSPRPPQPFFAALAREAAVSGLAVLRSAVPDGVATRFGLMSVADILASQERRDRACLGYRILGSVVRMTGLACGPKGQAMTRSDLVCALDRLDLIGGSGESPATLFFERSELARGEGCPSDRFSPDGRVQSWLDPNASLPPFEGVRTAVRSSSFQRMSAKL